MKRKQLKFIMGIDEVGRGPIAGPVTVCLFVSNGNLKPRLVFPKGKIVDSKKLKNTERKAIFKTLRHLRKSINENNINIDWALSSRSAKYIDRYGITESINKCIDSCVHNIEKKGYKLANAKIWLDGGLKVRENSKRQVSNNAIRQETVIRGDEKILEIALASIVAKVTRDTYMRRVALKHENYGWKTNVGYGTSEHYAHIARKGLSSEHRVKFIVIKH